MARPTTGSKRMVLACAAAALLAACAGEDALEAQRAQLAAEHEERMRRLEQVEIRLLTVGARQRAWDELQARHARISAIACANVADHVAAMEAHDEKQRQKRRQQRARRADAQARLGATQDAASGVGAGARASNN